MISVLWCRALDIPRQNDGCHTHKSICLCCCFMQEYYIKLQAEEAALKQAREALLKGKKKWNLFDNIGKSRSWIETPIVETRVMKDGKDTLRKRDCLSCRLTGTLVCSGLSGYLLLQTYATPPKSPVQRTVTLGCAGAFAALAVARAFL